MADTAYSPEPIAATVASLSRTAAEQFGSNIAARYKDGDEWRQLTYADVGAAIDEIALGLIELGLEHGDRVCILSDTRLEWTLASCAISAAGGVVVPIYPTNSPKECQWVAGNSGARAVFCDNAGQREKIEKIRDNLDALEHIIGF